jgi:hypothetical protein
MVVMFCPWMGTPFPPFDLGRVTVSRDSFEQVDIFDAIEKAGLMWRRLPLKRFSLSIS